MGVNSEWGRGILGMGMGVGFRVWGGPFVEPRGRRWDFGVRVLAVGREEELECEGREKDFGGYGFGREEEEREGGRVG